MLGNVIGKLLSEQRLVIDSGLDIHRPRHQVNHSNCIENEECTLAVTEATSGIYNLELDAVDWKGAVEKYRVAVEVKGEKSHYALAFLD
ncbi:hypothetical protein L2729_16665 [Shewanella gelidimarina]|uniref:hypothetical protein n=1 Tax=Shewanella gelidimarina TaxID=56813 RepID=UPI00200EA408|nr:hypothetical protein [Shewanella gelidimarina]MCL1059606.1 hypothetical protein [Shewanella gelidimarina]